MQVDPPLKFSIVTPSFKQPEWLRLCAASIADQDAPGLTLEHIVQDSLSGPEIAEAVKDFPGLKLVSEKDEGMYDAINRGWEKATGDIVCWLNCDEQYLPGALKEVADYFRAHPEVEVVFGDVIVVDKNVEYVCSRCVLTPQLYHTWTCHLQQFSSSTFFRSDLIKKRGFVLNSRWKDAGDAELIVRMLRAGVRMASMRRYLSTFVDSGENRNLQPLASQERKDLTKEAPCWVQALRPLWIILHRLRRFWNGIYSLNPFSYDVYTRPSPRQRVYFEVTEPHFYWPARMRGLESLFARSPVASTAPVTRSLKISVVTPSYKQLPWLKLCVASVADQKGVEVEHVIQDAQSGPELEAWVRENSKAQLYVEADSGMYDAINRGFARTTGDIVCWLNSDEQYLEGALAKVARYFETHPDVDVLFGDALLIANNGDLLSYRRTIFPSIRHIQLAHLNVLSCATFVRRSVLKKGYKLDTRWRAIADAVWIVSLLKAGIRMGILNEPLAVFTITDKNLGQSSLALQETESWQQETSPGLRWLRFGFVLRHRLGKLIHGAYWPRTVAARLYTLASGKQRITRSVSFLGFQWPHKI